MTSTRRKFVLSILLLIVLSPSAILELLNGAKLEQLLNTLFAIGLIIILGVNAIDWVINYRRASQQKVRAGLPSSKLLFFGLAFVLGAFLLEIALLDLPLFQRLQPISRFILIFSIAILFGAIGGGFILRWLDRTNEAIRSVNQSE